MRKVIFVIAMAAMLFGCTAEKVGLENGELLAEEFMSPPKVQRTNSTVLNLENLPIAEDARHDYSRQAREILMEHEHAWWPTADELTRVVTTLASDENISSAERANQVHTIGFMYYHYILQKNSSEEKAPAYSAVILEHMIKTKGIDYGTLAFLYEIGSPSLSAEERTTYLDYIIRGTEQILSKETPTVYSQNRDRILYASALEAQKIIARLNESK